MPSSSTTAKDQRAGSRQRNGTANSSSTATRPTTSAPLEKTSTDALGYDRIAERAYAIYEREGRPEGKHLEHWLRAEQELRGQPS